MRIAVLGGSGVLGGAVTAKALAAGHEVVAVSRRPPAQLAAGASHVVADVTTGDGLAAAFAGADAVIDGTNALAGARAVLVDGTRRVLEAAKAAGVRHFVGVSIVGIDTAPFTYYKVKVAQEKVIEASPVPWSLLRATQFHDLIPKLAQGVLGVVIAPRGWILQPIDVREVAGVLVEAAAGPPQQRMTDIGGPEIVKFVDIARAWLRAAHKRRWVISLPVPGATGRFLREGTLCAPEHKFGTFTFAQWLAETYPPAA